MQALFGNGRDWLIALKLLVIFGGGLGLFLSAIYFHPTWLPLLAVIATFINLALIIRVTMVPAGSPEAH